MRRIKSPLQTADKGAGPLLQRDYWAVLEPPEPGPRAVAKALFERFAAFAPPDLLSFGRLSPTGDGIEEGEVLSVKIEGLGTYRVRVVHRDELSLTLATEEGHPEAGRITFGVYPNANGETVVHIRSRARAGSPAFALTFPAAGKALQTTTWVGFLQRLAAETSAGIRDVIHEESREVEETEADRRVDDVPATFVAVDDRRGSEVGAQGRSGSDGARTDG